MTNKRALIGVSTAIGLVVVTFLIWLYGSGVGTAAVTLPDVRQKGYQWASVELGRAGFQIDPHDALGRDRGLARHKKDWKVCYETPDVGKSHKQSDPVALGVVKTNENCPSRDEGIIGPARETMRNMTLMPDLRNRTAFMTTKILGENASIKFIAPDGDDVTRGLGDWKVCTQWPLQGEPFNGVPVLTRVVRWEAHC